MSAASRRLGIICQIVPYLVPYNKHRHKGIESWLKEILNQFKISQYERNKERNREGGRERKWKKQNYILWNEQVQLELFIRIWKIIMPSATLDLRTSGISWAQTLPFPGGRKELNTPWNAASVLEWRQHPSRPVWTLFWEHLYSSQTCFLWFREN